MLYFGFDKRQIGVFKNGFAALSGLVTQADDAFGLPGGEPVTDGGQTDGKDRFEGGHVISLMTEQEGVSALFELVMSDVLVSLLEGDDFWWL